MTQQQTMKSAQALLRQLPLPAGDPFTDLLARLDAAEKQGRGRDLPAKAGGKRQPAPEQAHRA